MLYAFTRENFIGSEADWFENHCDFDFDDQGRTPAEHFEALAEGLYATDLTGLITNYREDNKRGLVTFCFDPSARHIPRLLLSTISGGQAGSRIQFDDCRKMFAVIRTAPGYVGAVRKTLCEAFAHWSENRYNPDV